MSTTGHDTPSGEPDRPTTHLVEDDVPSATASKLFDVRSVVAGVFVVYGLILTIVGLTADEASLAKSQQININLWTGLGCLALGIVFAVWIALRPATPDA